MKIGICLTNINELPQWQLRIMDKIINNTRHSLAVLLYNPKATNDFSMAYPLGTDRGMGSIQKGLLKLQMGLEAKYFFKGKPAQEYAEVHSFIKNGLQLPYTVTNGYPDLDAATTARINDQDLDVLISFNALDFRTTNINYPKNGFWSLVFRAPELQQVGPLGFWENVRKEAGIGSCLVRYTANNKQGEQLGSAYFNRHWSLTETARMVQEGSVSLLFKNLDSFVLDTVITRALATDFSIAKGPSVLQVLRYTLLFYGHFFNKFWEKMLGKFTHVRYECWSLFIGKTGFFEEITSTAIEIEMPTDEFWADPFLFEHKGIQYVFFENYSYKTKRGKISYGILENKALIKVADIMDFKYHLSFPFIFEENGELFLMPESSENERLEIYRAVSFPDTWELYTTAFEGEMVADAFFYTDKAQQKWLFLNRQDHKNAPMNSELFVYKVDGVALRSIEAHAQNPILIDARVARNAGAIFEKDGMVYRPSQRNVDGIYGAALNINKITKLTLEEYAEETVQVIRPTFNKKLMAMHHLHGGEGLFVFDAAYRKKW